MGVTAVSPRGRWCVRTRGTGAAMFHVKHRRHELDARGANRAMPDDGDAPSAPDAIARRDHTGEAPAAEPADMPNP